MDSKFYQKMLQERITQIRDEKNISEHKMSLDLGRSGSYIRNITNGDALPSVAQLFAIIEYFDMSPAEFFAPFSDAPDDRTQLAEKLRLKSDEGIHRINTMVDWIN